MGKIQEFYINVNEDTERCIPQPRADFADTGIPAEVLKVSGELVIVAKEDIGIKALKLELLGESRCLYSKDHGGKSKLHYSKVVLIKEKQNLLEGPGGANSAFQINGKKIVPRIRAGKNSYPFSFEAEALNFRRLPSTYKRDYNIDGIISYKLKAKLVKGTFSRDKKLKVPVKVYNPPPITADDAIPVVVSEEHGSVVLNASINKSAIALLTDDTIELTLSVDNYTDNELYPVVTLKETAMLQTPTDVNLKEIKLQKFEQEARPVASRVRKDVLTFTIGPFDDSISGTINSATNIHVSYDLVIKLKGSKVKIAIPIMIGGECVQGVQRAESASLEAANAPTEDMAKLDLGGDKAPNSDRALPPKEYY